MNAFEATVHRSTAPPVTQHKVALKTAKSVYDLTCITIGCAPLTCVFSHFCVPPSVSVRFLLAARAHAQFIGSHTAAMSPNHHAHEAAHLKQVQQPSGAQHKSERRSSGQSNQATSAVEMLSARAKLAQQSTLQLLWR